MGQEWVRVDDELPDDEIAVLTFIPSSSEPVWQGYKDGDAWFDPLGHQLVGVRYHPEENLCIT